jgi:hypothetical protein
VPAARLPTTRVNVGGGGVGWPDQLDSAQVAVPESESLPPSQTPAPRALIARVGRFHHHHLRLKKTGSENSGHSKWKGSGRSHHSAAGSGRSHHPAAGSGRSYHPAAVKVDRYRKVAAGNRAAPAPEASANTIDSPAGAAAGAFLTGVGSAHHMHGPAEAAPGVVGEVTVPDEPVNPAHRPAGAAACAVLAGAGSAHNMHGPAEAAPGVVGAVPVPDEPANTAHGPAGAAAGAVLAGGGSSAHNTHGPAGAAPGVVEAAPAPPAASFGMSPSGGTPEVAQTPSSQMSHEHPRQEP